MRWTRLSTALILLLVLAAAPPSVAQERFAELAPRRAPAKPARTLLTPDTDPHRVILKFDEGTRVRKRPDGLRGVGRFDAAALRAVLRAHGIGRGDLQRLFSRPEAELEAELGVARRRSGRALTDLNLYYQIQVPAGVDTTALCDDLNALPFVELASPAPRPGPPPIDIVPETTDLFASEQGHLAPPPYGIGVLDPAVVPGGDGAGTALVDIEFEWVLDHEDLELDASANIDPEMPNPGPAGSDDHGTAVLGVVGALVNGYGVDGIAPAAVLRVAPADTVPFGFSMARAISLATAVLGPGDVILLEMQICVCGNLCDPDTSSGFGPVEWEQATFDAIEMATGLGIAVVEAAGNGAFNLDSPGCLSRFDRAVRDSGAIMVGAGDGSRSKLAFSDFGSRVDVQAWGNFVVTTGYGDRFNGNDDPRQRYTSGFNGTSSASAIVAGAVLAIQAARAADGLAFLSPTALRQQLVDTGSPQDACDALGQHIGPLPSLPAALSLPACADGLDNDRDGFADFPADPGCQDSDDSDEFNPRSDCNDGVDNDGDLAFDYPADSDCSSASDPTEFHLSPGDIIVADSHGFRDRDATGEVFRVDPATGVQTLVASADQLFDPTDITVAGSGELIVAEFSGGQVLELDPATALQSAFPICADLPWGIARDGAGNLFVTDTTTGGILRLDGATQEQTLLASGGDLFVPRGIAIDQNGDLFVADSDITPAVVRVHPVTGAQTLISEEGNIVDPRGIAIDGDGNVLLANFGAGNILRVLTDSGIQEIVSSGGQLASPRNLAVEASGHIVVADEGAFGEAGLVIRIDPSIPDDGQGGNQTIVSSGGGFVDPFGIAVVPEPGSALSILASLVTVRLLALRRRGRARKRESLVTERGIV